MKRLKWMLIVFWAVLLIDSNVRLSTTEYTVYSPELPAEFVGYRIVQLSDLHAKEFGKNNARLVELIAQQQPDMIALTGDFIDSKDDLPVLATLIEQLSEISPVYFSPGNNDRVSGSSKAVRETVINSGGTYLGNEYLEVTRGNASIIIAGVEDPSTRGKLPAPDQFMEEVAQTHPNKYTVLLAHRYFFPDRYPDLPCQIILSGHCHGGVIRLPFLGGVLSPDKVFFPKYDAGLFESGSYTMVVSRGLGNTHHIPRFLNNPEVLVLTLA